MKARLQFFIPIAKSMELNKTGSIQENIGNSNFNCKKSLLDIILILLKERLMVNTFDLWIWRKTGRGGGSRLRRLSLREVSNWMFG